MKKLEMTYKERAKLAENPAAKKLFELMDAKKTNLILANDEHDPEKFLKHCETLGPDLAVVKTHIDILDDFTPSLIEKLIELSRKHNFMIFEDRKFADIGNTVKLQYSKGVYKIVDWADFVNIHIVPGPGIIESLKKVANEKTDGKSRGFLILAQMSSKGTMAVGNYTKKAIEMANEHKEAIAGFIGTGSKPEILKELSLVTNPGHVILTPGVKIGSNKDGLGQRYTHPKEAIAAGSDAVIVGRGIYQAENPITEAKKYRKAAWDAYLERTNQVSISDRVAEILLDIGAITLKPNNPFTYVSGIISPIYVDPRVLVSYPKQRKKIIEILINTVKNSGEDFDVIAGVGVEGIPAASWLARELDLPMIYLRSKAKGYGKENLIEGKLNKGAKVLLVTHMFTADDTLTNSVKAVMAGGGLVSHCIAISDHVLGNVAEKLRKLNVKTYALTDLKTILNTARITERISLDEFNITQDWLNDPIKWEKNYSEKIKFNRERAAKEVANILLNIDAVTLQPNKPFKYASGIISPIYTDNRLLLSHPQERNKIIEHFITVINSIGLNKIDTLGGVATSGIPHATILAEKLSLPMIYAYTKASEQGRRKSVEGTMKKGDQILIIEDLISTGGSSIKVAENIREEGGIVTDCLAIFTYGLEKAAKNFEDAGITLHALCDLKTLLKVAKNKNILTSTELRKCEEWIKNPEAWHQ